MKKMCLLMIKIYKMLFSPIFHMFGSECKFYPTCSEYAKQAIEKYGVIRGCLLSIKRIFKCNPFSKGGYDPLK